MDNIRRFGAILGLIITGISVDFSRVSNEKFRKFWKGENSGQIFASQTLYLDKKAKNLDFLNLVSQEKTELFSHSNLIFLDELMINREQLSDSIGSILWGILVGVILVYLLREMIKARLMIQKLQVNSLRLQEEIEFYKKREDWEKTYQEELKNNQEITERELREKNQFIANMGYELRTHLNGILGYHQLLLNSYHLPEIEQQKLEIINQCFTQLLSLIREMGDGSNFTSEPVKISPHIFNFAHFLSILEDWGKMGANSQEISFQLIASSELTLMIYADEMILKQMILNLLNPMIKFTKIGGKVTLQVERGEIIKKNRGIEELSLTMNPVKICFKISSTDLNISVEKLANILDFSWQFIEDQILFQIREVERTINEDILPLTPRKIEVSNSKKGGSEFSIELNLLTPINLQKIESFMPKKILGFVGKKRHILILDSHRESRAILRLFLRHLGFEVREANSDQCALEKMREKRPDLIIMDGLIPEINDLEVRLYSQNYHELKDLKILACSASLLTQDKYESLLIRGHDFLAKPIQIMLLLKKLENLLGVEWIYQEESHLDLITDEKQNPQNQDELSLIDLTIPTPEVIEKLWDLTIKGNFKGILRQADFLEELDNNFSPFANQLRKFSKNFQEKELLSFLQKYRLCSNL